MKLLFISHFFPPSSNAGTENYTLGLARAFERHGHQVEVICAEDWSSGRGYWNGVTEDRVTGILVRRLHLNWQLASNPSQALYYSPAVKKWLADYLGSHRPNLVHVTSTYSLGIGVIQAAREADIPTVLTLMDFWFMCPRTVLMTGDGALCDGRKSPWQCQQCLLQDSGLYRRSQRVIPKPLQRQAWRLIGRSPQLARLRGIRGLGLDMEERQRLLREAIVLPHRTLAHSRFVQQMHASVGLGPHVRQLANGHDLEWLTGYSGKTAGSGLRVGYMGQVAYSKGVHLSIEAFQLAGLDASASLDVWGNLHQAPDYVLSLEKRIGQDRRITLRGPFDRAQLGHVMANIDVLVVPSLWYENAPLVIHEAFATGTPVIATRLGGMAELVIHEENGLLFDRGDAEHLAEQLRRCAMEPDLLERLKEGIPPVKTVDQEIVELETMYRELIERGN